MSESQLPTDADPSEPLALERPTFREAFRFWLKLGLISFGGPAGQISIMHTELVERKRWIGENQFLHALNFCMLLPGPEAQQLATYIGWIMHRAWGGIVAGTLFVLPSIAVLWTLSLVYMQYGNVVWVAGVFAGLKPAVLAIVAAAVLRIGKKALKNWIMWSIAAGAFVAIFFFKLPFPAIMVGAGILGWIGSRLNPERFVTHKGHGGDSTGTGEENVGAPPVKSTWGRSLKIVAICVVIWWTPVFVAGQMLGWKHSIPQEGIFFSKAAMVTFGGAYAVLPYVAQRAVEDQGWLEPEQMLDGLGLAETTPGPLIMVVQFVGFVGGWQHPGDLPPLLAATLGALLTTWVTFVPCFLWIFLGAPMVERLHGHMGLSGALSTITAAVVGVILNLAVWFGIHVLFPGDSPDWFAIAICSAALLFLIRWKVDVLWVIGGGAILGVAWTLLSA